MGMSAEKVIGTELIVERERFGESQGEIGSKRNDTLTLSNNLTTTTRCSEISFLDDYARH